MALPLPKPLEEITLFDIYRAVDCVEHGELFHFHENPSLQCPVRCNIHRVLDDKLERIQNAMEQEMKAITVADIIRDTETYYCAQTIYNISNTFKIACS